MVINRQPSRALATQPLSCRARFESEFRRRALRRAAIGLLAFAALLLAPPARAGESSPPDDKIHYLADRLQDLNPPLNSPAEPWIPPEADPQEQLPESEDDEPTLDVGGALRLNYNWRDFNDQDRDKVGDFGFELFRLDVDAAAGDLGLSAQYRWYASFEAVHHAYFSYELSPQWNAHLGIHQVPFGILPYASHSFWFGATYYLGFEDDYDTGLKLLYENGPWDAQLAFYKNPEYVDSSDPDRYSFDLVTSGDQANEETNQVNLRFSYDWQPDPCLTVNLGASVEGGGIYNRTNGRAGDRLAYALHSDMNYGDWNFQLQWIDYYFHPDNPPGVDPNTVQMAAFQFPFLVASEGQVATINLARTFSTECKLIDTVTCYADFSKIFPDTPDSRDSTQLVLGCLLIAREQLYVYVDWIFGQNMWFAGGPGIGLNQPDSTAWRTRLNINFGYYF